MDDTNVDALKLQTARDNVDIIAVCLRSLMLSLFVVMFHIAVERGKKLNNPHNQGAAETESARSAADTKAWLEWNLRKALGYEKNKTGRIPGITLHFEIIEHRQATKNFLFGYTFKDEAEEWYAHDGDGYTEEWIKLAKEEYQNKRSDKFQAANANKR